MKPGIDFHLRDPHVDDQRVLYGGMLIACSEEDRWIAAFTGVPFEVAAGDELLVYYEVDRHFVQQPMQVLEVVETVPELVLAFEVTADPISAEERLHHRVSTLTAGVVASVGEESGCPVLDVSVEGFSVLACERHAVGTVLPVALVSGGERYEGRACIQSIRQRNPHRMRYGLRLVEVDTADAAGLAAGLQEITLDVQRRQLRRMSGG